jgi:hypothetical protein
MFINIIKDTEVVEDTTLTRVTKHYVCYQGYQSEAQIDQLIEQKRLLRSIIKVGG